MAAAGAPLKWLATERAVWIPTGASRLPVSPKTVAPSKRYAGRPSTVSNSARPGAARMPAPAAASPGVNRTCDRSIGARPSSRSRGVSSGIPPVYIMTTPLANHSTNRTLTGIPT